MYVEIIKVACILMSIMSEELQMNFCTTFNIFSSTLLYLVKLYQLDLENMDRFC